MLKFPIISFAAEDSSTTWFGSDRDYTYDELLKRVFEIILDKNPDMAAGRKPKFVMRPPQVLRVGTKKTSFANFTDICRTLHRQPKHLLDFLLAELGTSGSMDGNQQLIIKGRFQPKQIENVLRRYASRRARPQKWSNLLAQTNFIADTSRSMSHVTPVARPKPFCRKTRACSSSNANRAALGAQWPVLSLVSRPLPANVLQFVQRPTKRTTIHIFQVFIVFILKWNSNNK